MIQLKIKESDELLTVLKEIRDKKDVQNADLGAKVAALEVKMAHLLNLLTTVSIQTGEVKLNKMGRRFGGQSKELM